MGGRVTVDDVARRSRGRLTLLALASSYEEAHERYEALFLEVTLDRDFTMTSVSGGRYQTACNAKDVAGTRLRAKLLAYYELRRKAGEILDRDVTEGMALIHGILYLPSPKSMGAVLRYDLRKTKDLAVDQLTTG